MKKLQITLTDQQKLVRYFEKITQILLHLFKYINPTPSLIQIKNIIDYAHNVHLMVQEFYKSFPKKFVPIEVLKKLQSQNTQKSQKISQLLISQKNLKIEVKVLEDQLNQAQKKFKQSKFQKQKIIPEYLRKSMLQKEGQNQERLKLDKTQVEIRKKRMSLPQLSVSSSTNLLSKDRLMTLSNKKKSLFVNFPGEGSEILINHLIKKATGK